jgi:hypothetical protein
MRPCPRTRARAGFTLLEAILAVGLFSMLVGGFLFSVERMSRASDAVDVSYTLAVDGFDAVRSIVDQVSRTGYRQFDGSDMPVFSEDGEPGEDHLAFAHEPPSSGEEVRDLVYRLPQDADADGWPDVDGNGEAVWDPVEYGLLCLTLADGTDALVLRRSDGTTRVLARDVARVVFETPAQTGFTIPLDSLRFTLTLRRPGSDGRQLEFEAQRVVRLRNGGFAP